MTPNQFQPPRTVNEVQALLRHLQLPQLNAEALQVISRHEGDQFRSAITAVANQGTGWETHKTYLACVITACVPVTKAVIESLGIPAPPLNTLIDISKQEGRPFANAIRAIKSDADGPDMNAMKGYVRQAINRHLAMNPLDDALAPPPEDPPRAPVQQQSAPMTPPAIAQPPTHQQERPRERQPANVHPFPARNEPAATTDEGRKFESFHAYGGKAALCFSLDTTRKGEKPTVRIEAAPSSGTRTYDWSKKVAIQLTPSELPLVFGVLYGFMSRVDLTGHGHNNEKAFSIEDQGEKYFMSMRVRDAGVFGVPVLPKDTFPIMGMLLKQLILNNQGLPSNHVLQLVKRVCEKHGSAQQQPRYANG